MTGKHIQVAEWAIAEWTQEFSPLNVRGEMERMEQFLEANPRRRRKNYRDFIREWLSREAAKVRCDQVKAKAALR